MTCAPSPSRTDRWVEVVWTACVPSVRLTDAAEITRVISCPFTSPLTILTRQHNSSHEIKLPTEVWGKPERKFSLNSKLSHSFVGSEVWVLMRFLSLLLNIIKSTFKRPYLKTGIVCRWYQLTAERKYVTAVLVHKLAGHGLFHDLLHLKVQKGSM